MISTFFHDELKSNILFRKTVRNEITWILGATAEKSKLKKYQSVGWKGKHK